MDAERQCDAKRKYHVERQHGATREYGDSRRCWVGRDVEPGCVEDQSGGYSTRLDDSGGQWTIGDRRSQLAHHGGGQAVAVGRDTVKDARGGIHSASSHEREYGIQRVSRLGEVWIYYFPPRIYTANRILIFIRTYYARGARDSVFDTLESGGGGGGNGSPPSRQGGNQQTQDRKGKRRLPRLDDLSIPNNGSQRYNPQLHRSHTFRHPMTDEWSPHLAPDRTAQRLSVWTAPRVIESKDDGIFSRRRIQIWMFCLGFIFPFGGYWHFFHLSFSVLTLSIHFYYFLHRELVLIT